MPSRSKIARLPNDLRDQLNLMLRDGVRYDAIIAKHREHGVALTKSDLSRWYKRGFQQWLNQRLWLEEMNGRLEHVLDMVSKNQTSNLPEARARWPHSVCSSFSSTSILLRQQPTPPISSAPSTPFAAFPKPPDPPGTKSGPLGACSRSHKNVMSRSRIRMDEFAAIEHP